MSKRELFAAMNMASVMSAIGQMKEGEFWNSEVCAHTAVEGADALIAELAKAHAP